MCALRAQSLAVLANGVVCMLTLIGCGVVGFVSTDEAPLVCLPVCLRSGCLCPGLEEFTGCTMIRFSAMTDRVGEAAEPAGQCSPSAEQRRRETSAAGQQPQRAAQRVPPSLYPSIQRPLPITSLISHLRLFPRCAFMKCNTKGTRVVLVANN